MSNPFEQWGNEQDQRYQLSKKNAFLNGLALVPLSPRRYIVVRFGSTVVGETPYAYFGGSLVFGPASYERCNTWIHQTLRSLPTEEDE